MAHVEKYTQRRDVTLSKVKGWIRGKTKIGRKLKVPVSYHQGRYGLEIMINSFGDKTRSWVMIVNGINKYVTENVGKNSKRTKPMSKMGELKETFEVIWCLVTDGVTDASKRKRLLRSELGAQGVKFLVEHEWRSRPWCCDKDEDAKQNGIADASFKRTCETDLLTVDAKRLN